MNRQSRERGFTLVELLVAILVAGICMAAFPIARGYLPVMQVNGATRALAMQFREARAMAIQRGYDVIVVLDTEARRINVYADSELDGIESSDLVKSHSYSYYGRQFEFRPVTTSGVDGLTISSALKLGDTNPPSVTFRPNGGAVNAGVIYVTSSADSKVELGRAIEILSTGWVQNWIFNINGSPGPWKKWI